MKDTDHKHLTLKTAFVLALTSGKHRSEIHAWVANKVSNLGQWDKVAILDRPFKEDRTLRPVRALRYYLDHTKDLRGSRSLLFISF